MTRKYISSNYSARGALEQSLSRKSLNIELFSKNKRKEIENGKINMFNVFYSNAHFVIFIHV